MTSVTKAVFAVLILITCRSFVPMTGAQSPSYEKVESGKVLAGKIPNGVWIETTAYTWFTDRGAIFNFNQPSAGVPMSIDVAGFAPENVRQLRSQCGAGDGLSGGCWAKIRGQTVKLGGRQGILAREIQVITKQ